jgi:hypothetical protein
MPDALTLLIYTAPLAAIWLLYVRKRSVQHAASVATLGSQAYSTRRRCTP